MVSSRSWKLERASKGFCSRCGKRKPVRGKKSCRSCKKWEAQWARSKRLKQKRLGLCTVTGCHNESKTGVRCRPCNEKHSMANLKRNLRLKLQVIALLGGKCSRCGEADSRVLQVNHCNGGGRNEIRQTYHGTYPFYRAIVSGERPSNDLELLCANHNILYEYERGKIGKAWRGPK